MDRSAYLTPLSRIFLKFYRVTRKLQSKRSSLLVGNASNGDSDNFGIVISTFEDRFFTYALPLIKSIRFSASTPITLVINGNVARKISPEPLARFLEEISQIPDVYPVTFQNFQGCAKMWNTGILFSNATNLLILNDDIEIVPDLFKSEIPEMFSALGTHSLATINFSWSHFLFSTKSISDIGWFDEKLLGIGNEDGDYSDRYKRLQHSNVPNINLASFVNISDSSRDSAVAATNIKYSLFNEVLHKLKIENEIFQQSDNLYPLWKWTQTMRPHLISGDSAELKRIMQNEWGKK
jgi:hypothetical protein